MLATKTPDLALVNSLFYYDEGFLYHKVDKSGTARKGDRVGDKSTLSRYMAVSIESSPHLVHRIIFYIYHGYMPEYIDHIDQDKRNNKIENLRPCSKSLNGHNQGVSKANKTGYKGVFRRSSGRYLAYITKNGKRIYLGHHDTAEEAAHAYNLKAKSLYGSNAVVNRL